MKKYKIHDFSWKMPEDPWLFRMSWPVPRGEPWKSWCAVHFGFRLKSLHPPRVRPWSPLKTSKTKEHKQNKHSVISWYQCAYCGYKCDHIQVLDTHIEKEHSESVGSRKSRKDIENLALALKSILLLNVSIMSKYSIYSAANLEQFVMFLSCSHIHKGLCHLFALQNTMQYRFIYWETSIVIA